MKAALGSGVAGLLVAIATTAVAAAPERKQTAADNEFTIVPVAGGDSDIGVGVGYIASFARLEPERDPYLYRLESAGVISFLPNVNDKSLEVSYLDDYLLLELPHVVPQRLKLSFRVSYTRATTLKFYGFGNASTIDAGRAPSDDYYEYERTYPTVRLRAAFRASPALVVNWGMSFEQDTVTVLPGGQLAETLESGSAAEKSLLVGTGKFGVVSFLFGAAWDSRDDEVSTHRGQFHELRAELAPGGTEYFPQRWGRASAISRFYLPVIPARLTLAARAVADLLFGEPPFYELSRFDGSSALGGLRGVRGIPADRYYGKLKFFGNLELRSELFSAHFLGKKNTFGVAGFFDAGRVFADYRSIPELDGTGLGLKYGTGGGVRVAAGESFVLRFDVAWSPDAHPIGAYLTSGQCF